MVVSCVVVVLCCCRVLVVVVCLVVVLIPFAPFIFGRCYHIIVEFCVCHMCIYVMLRLCMYFLYVGYVRMCVLM